MSWGGAVESVARVIGREFDDGAGYLEPGSLDDLGGALTPLDETVRLESGRVNVIQFDAGRPCIALVAVRLGRPRDPVGQGILV